MKKKIFPFILLLIFVLVNSKLSFAYNSKAYILMDRQTKKVLAAENEHEKLPMASTTKIMTAIVVLELGKLDDYFTIPKEAAGIEGSSMYLKEGETIKVIDLLYGLMIKSGNDAATALAIYIGGSEEHFLHLMNRKAKMIGAYNTSFANPHGLDAPNHYTTAYDLSLITAYAMENPLFRQIASATYYRSVSKEGIVRDMYSNNKFLLYYPYASASKTGFTTPAGRCLSAVGKKDQMELISVFLNSPDWFNNAMKLLNWGFDNYQLVPLILKDTVVDVVDVENGKVKKIPVISKEDVFYPVKKGEQLVISSDKKIFPLKAPIKKGEKVGEMLFYHAGELIYSQPLVASDGVDEKPLPWYKRFVKMLNFLPRVRGYFSW
ncbi:D-alanyl-D-alanine carboxypeptidase (penicillin-binding protein 5/6) [Anaerobranca californiensis DSM 14826]|jgi:D-alanyl-D-alanine carboxypeptidase (penicillin-binding protein 5/6)|uniref:serine-type D-Ala-D-Ala carboxypeptidase n=1 Tax=Anaerobranca californiensis DSM 14826 TaxID=1120989 RepID=A0A1M6L0U0_9FIRM|nr:D-alanyl-D-alanine carboxypeptidase family protein [Anaerobranca californiensis]SHJ64895.1 D-alanyl-D-alanine carboxypeptidase (penicillin-binding protein 5/6) [Anaerobranca californiensis DSM 14826]